MDIWDLESLWLDPDQVMHYIMEKWHQEQDAKPITLFTKLSAALNKCPAPWINAICLNLGLSSAGKKSNKVKAIVAHLTQEDNLRQAVLNLPPTSRQVLKRVVDAGGWVKYGQLSREYGDEEGDGWFWNEEPPVSAIGRVRAYGLLFVGRAPIKSRNYKVAVVPKELREPLAVILADESVMSARAEPEPAEGLTEVLESVREYYEEAIDWEPQLPRDWVEDFLRHQHQQGAGGAELFELWDHLRLFHFFLDHYGHEIVTMEDLKGYHLSEWVNDFLRRKVIPNIPRHEKRRMLRTVQALYEHLAHTNRVDPKVAQRVAEAVDKITRPRRKLGSIDRPPPLGGEMVMRSYHPTQGEQVFTFNDYWLAILCYVDYEGDWKALRRATVNVTDGRTKRRLIDRLSKVNPSTLEVMLRQIYEEDVEEARDWFRHHHVVEASAW